MAKSKKEVGDEFLKGVLAMIPEAQRAAIAEALSPQVEQLGGPIHDVMTRAEQAIAEASQKEQMALAYRGNLDKWYVDTQKTFTDAQTQLEARIAAANGSIVNDPNAPKPLTKDEITTEMKRMISESERQAVGAMGYFTTLATNHFKTFGESLDVPQLLRNAEQAQKKVDVYYNELVAPRRAEMETKRLQEHEASIRKNEREKVQAEIAKNSGHQAYPSPGFLSEDPSPLIGLKSGNGKDPAPQYGVQAALDAFYAKSNPQAS